MSTTDDPVLLIARATAGEVGAEFLAALVRSMHSAMDVSVAFITRGIGEPPVRARISYSWTKPGVAFPDEYDLEGTPCRLVYNGQEVVIPEQLWEMFPKEGRYQSYCGVPLANAAGRVIGHFSAISETPIRDPERAQGVLRLFAMRIAAEWQRLEREKEREELIGRLTYAVDRLGHVHHAMRQANQFKSDVLGMVAHDLRGPLSVVLTRAELIDTLAQREAEASAGNVAQQLRKSSAAIAKAAERMERMIGDLLASARNEAMSIRLNRAVINLADPVRVATSLNQKAAEAKAVRIATRLCDATVHGDEDKLIEAVDNLLSNAIKYSGQGTLVSVSMDVDHDARFAEVRVADEGLGMDEGDLSRAFQRFQKLSARPTGGESSTGLGLAIVKLLAEAHGGSVAAESAGKGRGSAFVLRVPLHDAARD